jgi:hypothetical protein
VTFEDISSGKKGVVEILRKKVGENVGHPMGV